MPNAPQNDELNTPEQIITNANESYANIHAGFRDEEGKEKEFTLAELEENLKVVQKNITAVDDLTKKIAKANPDNPGAYKEPQDALRNLQHLRSELHKKIEYINMRQTLETNPDKLFPKTPTNEPEGAKPKPQEEKKIYAKPKRPIPVRTRRIRFGADGQKFRSALSKHTSQRLRRLILLINKQVRILSNVKRKLTEAEQLDDPKSREAIQEIGNGINRLIERARSIESKSPKITDWLNETQNRVAKLATLDESIMENYHVTQRK